MIFVLGRKEPGPRRGPRFVPARVNSYKTVVHVREFAACARLRTPQVHAFHRGIGPSRFVIGARRGARRIDNPPRSAGADSAVPPHGGVRRIFFSANSSMPLASENCQRGKTDSECPRETRLDPFAPRRSLFSTLFACKWHSGPKEVVDRLFRNWLGGPKKNVMRQISRLFEAGAIHSSSKKRGARFGQAGRRAPLRSDGIENRRPRVFRASCG